MTTKHFFQVFLGMCYLAAMPADSFAADTGLDELRSRVTELEKKVDSLLSDRGESQRNVTTAEPNGNKTSENAPQSPQYEEGPLLDVWLLESEDLKKIPNIPPIGKMRDTSDLFNFGSFQTDDDLKRYYKNKATGLLWTGYLKIEKSGTYLIIHEFDVQPTSSGTGWSYQLYSRLKVGEKFVLEHEPSRIGGRGGFSPPKSALLPPLRRGFYKFELWLAGQWIQHPGWAGNYNLEPGNVSVRIKLREENSSKLMLITKALLFRKTNN